MLLFIFEFLYFKQKIWILFKKNDVASWKTGNFISSVGCLYEYSILYKYQITLIVFYSCLLSNNILKNIKKFGQKQIGISSASFEFEKC
jgi:hypothetical protein